MGSISPPISILGKEDGSIFRGKKKYCRPFHLTPTYPNRPIISPFVKSQTPQKKTRDSKKRSRKVNHQASRKQYNVRRLEEPFSLSKAAMPTIMVALAPTTNTTTTTMANMPVPSKPPSTSNVPTVPNHNPVKCPNHDQDPTLQYHSHP